MAGQFQPKAFFRAVSNSLLANYFRTRDIDLSVDVASLEEDDVLPIWDAWLALDDDARQRPESDFSDINELGDEGGVQVMLDQAVYEGLDIGDVLAQMDDAIDRAFWVFLNHPQLFETAFRFREADQRSSRRWHKRKNLPHRRAEQDDAAKERLAAGLSGYFKKREARGHSFQVEPVQRGDRQYFFAYGEDHARADQDFENGKLHRRSHRPAFEVVFVFDPNAGTLDTFAPGGTTVAADLEEIFGRELLHAALGKNERDRRVYEFEPFASRGIQFVYQPDWGIADISVIALRVSLLGRKGTRLTVEATTQDELYDRYERIVGPWAGGGRSAIAQATMQVTYEPQGRKPKKQKFSVSYPNGCNLKQDERDLRLRQMLVRSGIDPSGLGLDATRR